MIRALIVEDQHEVAAALRECLEADGYLAAVEHSGEGGSIDSRQNCSTWFSSTSNRCSPDHSGPPALQRADVVRPLERRRIGRLLQTRQPAHLGQSAELVLLHPVLEACLA